MTQFRDSSKATWNTSNTVEHINAGSFQRIADSLESLNRSWCGVQEQNVRFRTEIKTLENQNRALRGQITKLNKKVHSG